ncbi:MAG TPA: kelch repeat-containing protein [Anaerolineales bacterium]|jgi:DNA-binding CsgD family transcriptional regulator|nr:kelch repeat-containing protein [Anaerolineales bacterium]
MTDTSELSDREREILHLVATGASNKEIARDLYISTNTVKVHLRNIFSKIGVNSRTEAAMYAVSAGLVDAVSTSGENGFAVVSGDGDLNGNYSSETLSRAGGLQVLVSNPWLAGLLFLVLLAAGIVTLYWIRNSQSTTLASDGPPVATPLPRWQVYPSMPTARAGLAAVAYEDRIYAIAGESPDGVTNVLEKYDPSSNDWSTLAPKELPVADVGAVVIGGEIFVPGGRLSDGSMTDVLEIYDPRLDTWRRGASVPLALSAYAIAAFEGKLYLFGGRDADHVLDTVFQYDPEQDTWIERTSMPTARAYAGAAVAGGRIYVVGGFDGNAPLSVNEGYLPGMDGTGENPWTPITPLPDGRYAMGAAGLADIVHVLGGQGALNAKTDVLEFFPQQNKWQTLESKIPQASSSIALVPLETRLFVLGGSVGGAPTGQNLAYQAIYIISIPIVK